MTRVIPKIKHAVNSVGDSNSQNEKEGTNARMTKNNAERKCYVIGVHECPYLPTSELLR